MGFLVIYDLFANKYGMQPKEVQYMMTIISIPWVPKMFYGILIDSFPLCGSTKKSYLILLGTVFCIFSFVCGAFDFDSPRPLIAAIVVTMTASAMMDVVVDGLMVS